MTDSLQNAFTASIASPSSPNYLPFLFMVGLVGSILGGLFIWTRYSIKMREIESPEQQKTVGNGMTANELDLLKAFIDSKVGTVADTIEAWKDKMTSDMQDLKDSHMSLEHKIGEMRSDIENQKRNGQEHEAKANTRFQEFMHEIRNSVGTLTAKIDAHIAKDNIDTQRG